MKVMYYVSTESCKSQEAKLLNMITAAVPVEKVYMLGSSLQQQRTESVFMTDAPDCCKVGHYWLLVLVDKDCGHSDNYVQDKIENICQHFIPVTAIVLYTVQFNNWLTAGHRFACKVMERAVMIYDSNNIPLAIPNAINKTSDTKTTAAYCTAGANKVNEFLAGADLYRIRKQNKMAAFMLHQAAEQALHTIFRKSTGLYINTHNIDKLLRYCAMVAYQIPNIFPRDGKTNKKLLELLQRAYIDTRYREDFTISSTELITITERVRKFQEMI